MRWLDWCVKTVDGAEWCATQMLKKGWSQFTVTDKVVTHHKWSQVKGGQNPKNEGLKHANYTLINVYTLYNVYILMRV